MSPRLLWRRSDNYREQMVYLTRRYRFSASHRLHNDALTAEENAALQKSAASVKELVTVLGL